MSRPPRPVAMLTHSYYEEDPRVRREAESLVRAGRPVEVFALRREGDPKAGDLDGVRIHRLDVQRHQGAGLARYAREYLSFAARAATAATAAHRRARFALVQVHTLPDFLVFGALPFRLAGIPVVLDLHEAMPEFFRARFPRAANALVQRALLAQERASILAADAVLTVNDALAGRLISLGVPPGKVTVALNSPDLTRFDPGRFERRQFAADGMLRLVYAGALTPTYEVDVAIDAMGVLRRERPEQPITLDVYGRGDAAEAWRTRADAAGLGDTVRFHGRIAIEDVPAALAQADLGIAPTRRTEFTDYSLSTKIFEYGAMGKPVIASRLPMVERTFDPSTVATYEPGDAPGLAQTIARLMDDPLEREARVARTAARVRDLSWAHESRAYRALIERLIRRAGTGGGDLPMPDEPDDRATPAVAATNALWPGADPLTPRHADASDEAVEQPIDEAPRPASRGAGAVGSDPHVAPGERAAPGATPTPSVRPRADSPGARHGRVASGGTTDTIRPEPRPSVPSDATSITGVLGVPSGATTGTERAQLATVGVSDATASRPMDPLTSQPDPAAARSGRADTRS